MPLYEYDCDRDGVFDLQRPMSEYALAATCPSCGGPARRVLSAPRLAATDRSTVIARDRNEKSSHEPRIVAAGEVGRSPARDHGGRVTLRASKGRPWAIEHG